MAVVIGLLESVVTYGKRSTKTRLLVDLIGAALALALAFFIYRGTVTQAKFSLEGAQAHDYLCFQKTVGLPQQIRGVEARIASSNDYLRDVRLGLRQPIKGITSTDIKRGRARDMADLDRLNITKDALKRVHCK